MRCNKCGYDVTKNKCACYDPCAQKCNPKEVLPKIVIDHTLNEDSGVLSLVINGVRRSIDLSPLMKSSSLNAFFKDRTVEIRDDGVTTLEGVIPERELLVMLFVQGKAAVPGVEFNISGRDIEWINPDYSLKEGMVLHMKTVSVNE